MTTKNEVYSWGNNEFGQCGVEFIQANNNPQKINIKNIRNICCGNEHSLILNNYDEVFSFGKNDGGVLGYEVQENQYTPKKIPNLKNISLIACGSLHNLAFNSKGEIYSWGSGEGGQLGLPENLLVNYYLILK